MSGGMLKEGVVAVGFAGSGWGRVHRRRRSAEPYAWQDGDSSDRG